MCNGDWLFSVEVPTELPPGSGTVFDPRDVIRYNGLAYTAFFVGASMGVPTGANLDALFLEGNDFSDLVVSFDVPTTLGTPVYDPADLVRVSGGSFSLYFDASAATPPVPKHANVTGADQRGGPVLTFDVPTTLGPTFLTGELVAWDGAAFTSFFADPAWPKSSRVDAMSFPADPGSVPLLLMGKSPLLGGNVVAVWSPSTSAGADDYGIYEGSVGTWYSHQAMLCHDTGGDLTEDFTPATGDSYYIVVPMNGNDEGSYGLRSSGLQRPTGSPTACRPTQALDCP
jgi:hypothetical protein